MIFIAWQQSCFYKEPKQKRQTGKIAGICDFPEYYSSIQDDVQDFHRKNTRVTLCPPVAYNSQN
jgi:hypothetical protein